MLSHKRVGLTRGKTVLIVLGALLAVILAVTAVEWLSFTRLLKDGAVDTLDSLDFRGKFTAEKGKTPQATTAADVSSKDSPAVGNENAPVIAVEFIDFSCPYSKEESSIIRGLAADNPERIRLEIRDFPLEDHPDARRAALAASCAAEQGKYWAMHDALFTNQAADGAWSDPDLRKLAIGSGIDGKKYDACMKDGKYLADIDADVRAGQAAGVTGTPTFFVNGYKIDGAIPLDIWQKILKLSK